MPSALARLRLLLAFFRIPFAGAGASNTGRFRGLWALADSLEESPYLKYTQLVSRQILVMNFKKYSYRPSAAAAVMVIPWLLSILTA